MSDFKKYFATSFIFAFACLGIATVIGLLEGGVSLAAAYFASAIALWVLEMSVSLDNAVVNATVLKGMDAKWKRIFLTWGILIAVFGMRLVFPIIIVSAAAWITPWHAAYVALFQPVEYQAVMQSVHTQVMAFGSAFLLLVAGDFFFSQDKEHHWIGPVEKWFQVVDSGFTQGYTKWLVTLLYVGFVSLSLQSGASEQFLLAGVIGMTTYYAVQKIGDLIGGDVTGAVARTGLAGFIYLEVLDASFSFDGVIAAFAITNNFLIIAAGLGAGAMFVRSITIYLVDKDTLTQFKYLEHGAFWSILWLVVSMGLAAAHVELGEIVIAGVSAGIIFVSALWSKFTPDAPVQTAA